MRPMIDYAEPTNTRTERRRRIFWRCMWVGSIALFCLSLWDFVSAVNNFNDRRSAEIERAAKLGKASQ